MISLHPLQILDFPSKLLKSIDIWHCRGPSKLHSLPPFCAVVFAHGHEDSQRRELYKLRCCTRTPTGSMSPVAKSFNIDGSASVEKPNTLW